MTIKRINWQQALPIRHQVLWPTESPEFCKVEADESAMHYGYFVKEKLVAVASIYIDGKKARLRKFATLGEYQSQGIGTQLVAYILTDLTDTQASVFWCDARATAVGFYQRQGLIVNGTIFYKSGVAYYKMSRDV
ncbi:GNAT family N-acetyltransferase [Vibrio tapetis subsp. quintayensis]|uniref:GNAT family N-acetyltransferase n=1 Tax=Vibrio tapetis TaxID=52443 RepID=UPI0025B32436|nr:GNAT family N-acetyltransferase [Vibrio tapetis]MDN3681100.1 GNAT family N-acetyltransferase [Vibrio tapetis subsp. quintayensis]